MKFKFTKFLLPIGLFLPLVMGLSSNAQQVGASDDLDFEFNSPSSISGFVSEGSTITHAHDTAMLVEGGSNLVLTSPTLSTVSGNKYSALLPSRNTIFVRIKNSTNASKVKVHFITTLHSTWSDSQSKEFDIEPNSDYKSYFFNLSDNRVFTRAELSDNEYLKQFKLTFDNTTEGSVEIEAFSLEREDEIVRYVGNIESCLANKEEKTVTIKGKVNSAYKTKEVTVIQSDAQNYDDRIQYSRGVVLAKVMPDNEGNFEAKFDLMRNEQTTHLCSKFIAVCDEKRVDKTTMISNIEDFSIINKEERFKIPETIFNVLDYGAKGDAFTNDTNAIQAAIDAATVSGGVVLIPGDTSSPTGRRYMMTHIDLKSNVEFRIEEGAVLWQSPRYEEYHYAVPGLEEYDKPVYGHDLDMDGIMWCHACATVNLPFIYTEHATNVRITGGGQIRMMDPGVEVEDAQIFLGDPSTNHGCKNIIHLSPICAMDVINYDVTDIEIHKASGWHCTSSVCENVWYSNVIEYDTCCVTSDGMSMSRNKHSVIERCMSYTSDDGLVLSAGAYDPRHFLFSDVHTITREHDFICEDVYVAHNFAWGGFGCSFIPWGSDMPDFSKIGIKNIELNDNIFGGQKSVGVWNDDPYYGYSKYGTYNSTEDNDYVPMSDIHFHNNTYLNGFQLYLNGNRMPVTNLLVEDTTEYSSKAPSTFQHGNFDKNVRVGPMYDDESTWTVGLSNWSYDGDENVEFGTKQEKEGLGYSGYIKGNGRLYEGLYELQGYYKVSMKTKSLSGSSYFFVQDRLTKEILKKDKIENSEDFVNRDFYFNNLDERLLLIGVMHEGDNQIVYFDDCKILRVEDAKLLGAYTLETFENDMVLLVDNPEIELVEGNKMLVLGPTKTSMLSLYQDGDFGFDLVSGNNEEKLVLSLNSGENSSDYNIPLNNLNDGLNHYLGLRVSSRKIEVYLDYQKVNEINRSEQFDMFNVSLSTTNKVYIDNLLVTDFGQALFEKTLALVTFENENNYEINFVNNAKFVGENYSFKVKTNDEIEVYVNNEKVASINGVYSFELSQENVIKIVKKTSPIVDPDDPIDPNPDKGDKNTGLIIGVVAGSVGAVGLAVALVFIIRKRKLHITPVIAGIGLISISCSMLLGQKALETRAIDSGVDAVLVNRSITGGGDYLTFTADKVTNSAAIPGTWTEFVWGSQNDGTVETTSFDITCHYSSGSNGILTLQFNRWDAAQLYKVEITQTSMIWTRWGWSEQAQTGVPVETLGQVGFGLKDNETYHIDYIRSSWDKMLFINNTKVFSISQGELTVGCLGIETWELGYELENITRRDGYDTDLWNMSTLDSYKDQLVSELNGEINKISETAVRIEASKLISKFIADLNKIYLKDDMDALYQEYKKQIQDLNIEDINNMSKMKKVYTGLEYVGATDASKYLFTKFDTIYLPVANNNESAVAYHEEGFGDKYVVSAEFAPQILNYWTIAEFRFNFIDQQNYYAMRMTDHSVEFVRVENGSTTKTFTTSNENCSFKNFRFTVEGNQTNLKLFVNGKLMVEDAVTNATNKVCFRVWNGGMCISDLTYFSYKTLKESIDFISNYEKGSSELKEKYIALVHAATCEAKVVSLKYEFKNAADR